MDWFHPPCRHDLWLLVTVTVLSDSVPSDFHTAGSTIFGLTRSAPGQPAPTTPASLWAEPQGEACLLPSPPSPQIAPNSKKAEPVA
ncbi:MAG: hypothetical protein IGS48_01940 [Oscillatoriales cyanobacterium C42_A2020_001]|nr:hypothetical protein [Leptolyngbyaceae cyanobacterium C42_A2020_001]